MILHVVYGIPKGLWSPAQPYPGIPSVPCASGMGAQLLYLDVGLINLQGNPSAPLLAWLGPQLVSTYTVFLKEMSAGCVWRLGPSE